ncbi:MAG TPA: PAS domain S-box protein [Chthoniobacterales bacterium]
MMHREMSSRLVALVIAFSLLAAAHAGDTGEERKNVLILCGERPDLPAVRAVMETFRERFGAATAPRVEWFSEYFDFARFPAEQHEANLVRYLSERYAGRHIDLVLPLTGFALDFALRHRDQLFPGVPMVFIVLDPREVKPERLPADVTGVTAHLDFQRTVDLALQLQPQAREIVAVSGASALDASLLEQGGRVLDGYKDRIPWRAVAQRPLREMIEEVRRVRPGDIVLFISAIRDSEGRALTIPEVSRALVRVSAAPIYGLSGTVLDTGAVGGALIDFPALGRQAAELALKVLRGAQVPYGTPETDTRNPLIVDWRALKKWQLPESRLPAEAIVRFKPPSLWKQHPGIIIGVVAVMAMQSALIARLLVNRAKRRRAVRALAESEERMALAADAANLGMWVWDVAGEDAWMTEQGRALFGFKPDARIDYSAIFDRVHPEDREAREAAIKRALETQGKYEMEYRVQLPDGAVRWIAARGRSVGKANGRGQKLLGVSMDVTAQKQAQEALRESEARFRTVANTAPVMIWMSGTDKRCTFFNKGWLDFTGRAMEQELGHGWAEGVHRDDFDRCLEIYARAFEARKTFEMEYRLRRADGEYRWVLDNGTPRFSSDGVFLGYIGSCVDITERKQAELEVARQRSELSHLARVALVGEMATSLAHELNQPLTAIVANASAAHRFLARGNMSPDEFRELLVDIVADGCRAGEVIRGIKGMVRKVESERRALNVNEVVADVLRLVRADALAHGCTLTTKLEPTLSPVLGDAVQLQQVLLNLIINAFDAMRKTPNAPCRVEIQSRMIDTHAIEVAVRDFGPGLPADSPSRVFERFYSTKGDGMGMGLAIARSIIEAHAGTLDAENAEGGGARFWFRVPAYVTTPAEVPV